MVDIFAEMKNYKHGGSDVAGLTGVASQGLYTVFKETQDNLAITIIEVLMLGAFQQNNILDCPTFSNLVSSMMAT